MSRDISSSSCTGQEAVRIVIIETWMKINKIDDEGAVEEMGARVLANEDTFLNFTDNAVGRVLLRHTDVVDALFEWVNANPIVRMMSNYEYVSLSRNREWAETYLSSHLGCILKETKWWENNKKTIDKYRKNLKMVGKIMSE